MSRQSIPQIKSGQFDVLISGGALITGRVRSSAFVEMIKMVRNGKSAGRVYQSTGEFGLHMSTESLFCGWVWDLTLNHQLFAAAKHMGFWKRSHDVLSFMRHEKMIFDWTEITP